MHLLFTCLVIQSPTHSILDFIQKHSSIYIFDLLYFYHYIELHNDALLNISDYLIVDYLTEGQASQDPITVPFFLFLPHVLDGYKWHCYTVQRVLPSFFSVHPLELMISKFNATTQATRKILLCILVSSFFLFSRKKQDDIGMIPNVFKYDLSLSILCLDTT